MFRSLKEIMEARNYRFDADAQTIFLAQNGVAPSAREETVEEQQLRFAEDKVTECDTADEYAEAVKPYLEREDALELWDIYWSHYDTEEARGTGN